MGLANTISKISPSPGKLRIFAVTILILVVPVVIYYTSYVKKQTAYFTSRDFRKLALIGSQVATKVDNVSIVFKNACEKFITTKSESPVVTQKPEASPVYDPKSSEKENSEALQKSLEILKEDGLALEATGFTRTDLKEIDLTKGYKSTVTIEVSREDGGVWLYLEFLYEATDKRSVSVRARTDFNALMMPLINERSSIEIPSLADGDAVFDNTLIASAAPDTNVFLQQNTSEFQLISLDRLTQSGGEGKLDINTIDKVSSVVDVKLAGVDFKAFLHPINLTVSDASQKNTNGTRWIVCGLVSLDRFQKEALAISYTVLIFFGFVCALAILSWPFLKLLLIGPKDRLRTADIYFLTFSVLIGTALATTFGLYVYSYLRLEARMDKQLHELSGTIESNLRAESKAALEELDELNGVLKTTLKSEKFKSLDEASKDQQSKSWRKVSERSNILPDILKLPNHNYPYFDTAVWIDPIGHQRIKWTIRNYTTQFIDVSSRPYFTNLKEGHYRYLDGHKYRLEPILSKTTGRNEVEISKQVDWDPNWVSAFDSRLLSLMQPVLPSGYGYCIIDNDGKVLFHSDETHHLRENLFQEVDNDVKLRSAVLDRTEDTISLRYMGRGHRFFTTPVKNFPTWSLIVFRDKQVLRTTFLELLTLSSLLFLVYSLILLAAFIIFYIFNLNTTKRREWLWPSEGQAFNYCVSAFTLLVLAILSAYLSIVLNGLFCIVVVVSLSMTGIILFFLMLKQQPGLTLLKRVIFYKRWKDSSNFRKKFFRHDHGYALNLTFLLLLIAIIPSFAFFKFAYEAEITLFIKYGQVTIADGLTARDERITSRHANRVKKADDPVFQDFLSRRKGVSWDIYDKFFFATTKGDVNNCAAHSVRPPNSFLLWLNWLMPRPNQISVESRGLIASSFADGSRRWEVGSTPTGLVLHVNASGPASSNSYHMNTEIPGFIISGPWAWTIFFIAFILFFLLIRFIVRTVFLFDLHKPSSDSFQNLLTSESQNNLFVILDVPQTQSKYLISPQFHSIDISSSAHNANWAEKFDYHKITRDRTKIIAVNHFEHKMDDPEWNRQRTSFLEKLLTLDQRIVVLSTAEPTRFRFVKSTGNDQDVFGGSPVDGADRWTGVISRFLKCYAEDNGDAPGFEKKVDERKMEILKKADLDVGKDEIDEIVETLKHECSPKEPLQNIGLEILNQSDFERLSREHLINRIMSQATTYYQDIWQCCSNDERLTLFHLAQDRLLSPKDHDIEPLMRKGLIVRDPDLHLMNESFRRFVKTEKGAQVLANYEGRARKESSWNTLKVPLLVVLASVVVFLFATQRDMYDSSLAIMTAITTFIPSMFKLLSYFQKEPVSRNAETSFFGRDDK